MNVSLHLPVERTGETLETGTVGQEGIRESTANQVSGVSRHVATFVITMESKVQTEEILEVLVLLAALAQHGSEVVGPILIFVDLSGKSTTALVGVLVDLGGNGGKLSKKRDGVIEGRLPVVSLVQALLVGLGELGLVVESRHGHGELGHGMKIRGEVVKHLVDEGGELSLLSQFSAELSDLVNGGDLAGKEEPEHGLGKHFGTSLALRKLLLAVLDGTAVETNTLVGVENRAFPNHGLETSHATEGVLDLDFSNDLAAVSLDLLEELTLGRNGFLQGGLEVEFGGSIAAGTISGTERLEKQLVRYDGNSESIEHYY